MLVVSICITSLPHIIVTNQAAGEISEYCDDLLSQNDNSTLSFEIEAILNCSRFTEITSSITSLYGLETYCKQFN